MPLPDKAPELGGDSAPRRGEDGPGERGEDRPAEHGDGSAPSGEFTPDPDG